MTATSTGEGIDLAAFPRRAVAAIAGGAGVLLLAVAPRYGWHRDELYFLESGRHHLAWGYVDQPPFTPFVARIADAIAPGNLVVLRLAPALVTVWAVVLGALIVRELGGRTRSQAIGAGAVAAGGFTLGVGHLLATAAFDFAAWLTILWLVTRLLRTADPRWWLVIGVVGGLSMLNKNLLVLLGIALGGALLIERRWDVLWSPWLVAGGVLALAIAAPNLLWQADHGWPQADMARALSKRLAAENRVTLVPLQVLFVGPALVVALVRGARSLARDTSLRPLRALLWAWPIGLIVTFAAGGRPYYALPLTTMIVLAGVVESDRRGGNASLTRLVAINALISLPLSLPLLPDSSAEITSNVNEAVAETVGWPELTDQVAGVVGDLPAAERDHVMILTGSYGEAGAIDRFGPSRGLPPAYSGHNSYWFFRTPTDDNAVVVAIRLAKSDLAPYFDRCEQIATVDNGRDIDNEVQGQPILVCRDLKGSWREIWPKLKHLS